MDPQYSLADYGRRFSNSMDSLASDPAVREAASDTLISFMRLRIFVTILLLAWGLAVSTQYFSAKSHDRKDKIAYVHRIWFGHTPLVQFLFYMWIFTTVALIVYHNVTKMRKTLR